MVTVSLALLFHLGVWGGETEGSVGFCAACLPMHGSTSRPRRNNGRWYPNFYPICKRVVIYHSVRGTHKCHTILLSEFVLQEDQDLNSVVHEERSVPGIS